jgi:predicted Zn-dependent protease
MGRRWHFMGFAALAGALGTLIACATAPITGRSQIMLVSPQDEAALGIQAYQQLAATEPAVNAGGNSLVGRVGRRIAAAAENPPDGRWKAPGFDWEFRVINKPGTVNAFCLPGGKIGVYTGILPVARDEAGLAVIIGHEVGHALARHGGERISQAMVAQLGQAAATAALSRAVKGDPSYSPMIQQALGIGIQVGFLLPMSRTQESEADRIGLILMAIAGYNPNAAVGLWERMRAVSGGKGGPEFLRTHPTETTRIADIQSHLPEAMKYYKGR